MIIRLPGTETGTDTGTVLDTVVVFEPNIACTAAQRVIFSQGGQEDTPCDKPAAWDALVTCPETLDKPSTVRHWCQYHKDVSIGRGLACVTHKGDHDLIVLALFPRGGLK